MESATLCYTPSHIHNEVCARQIKYAHTNEWLWCVRLPRFNIRRTPYTVRVRWHHIITPSPSPIATVYLCWVVRVRHRNQPSAVLAFRLSKHNNFFQFFAVQSLFAAKHKIGSIFIDIFNSLLRSFVGDPSSCTKV